MSEKLKIITDEFGMGKDLVFEPADTPQPEQQAAPEPEQIQPEPQEIAQPEPAPAPVKETRNASNFRALKEQAAKIARERDEMKALLEQYQRAQQAPTAALVSEPDDIEIDPEGYAEGKHVKTLAKQIKQMKDELERTRKHTQGLAVKAALISEHPDFEKVVTQQNLATLEMTYPHLAKAINVNDPYTAGKACYDLIKQFGIDNDDAQESEIAKAVIAQNMAKPKPAAAVKGTRVSNESTMGRASEFYTGELNDQMKKQFYKELQDAMKGYGGYKP